MTKVWDRGPDDPIERYVLLKLADNADHDGRCFPSLPEITEKTRLSISTVRRAIAGLESSGWVSVQRGRGAGHRSRYLIHEKVSEENLSERKLSGRKVSQSLRKGVTLTQKGVRETELPHPHKGVTVNNRQEPSITLPEWLPLDSWKAFIKMRKSLRNVPWTEEAEKKTLNDLEKLRLDGNDPAAVLDRSVQRGWRGVFELPKEERQGDAPATRPAYRNAASLYDGPEYSVDRRPA